MATHLQVLGNSVLNVKKGWSTVTGAFVGGGVSRCERCAVSGICVGAGFMPAGGSEHGN